MMMNSHMSANVIANFFGKGCSALFSLFFIPIYLSFLGVEGYGLISFFNVLIVLSSMLDLGMGSAVNKEMARLRAANFSSYLGIYQLLKSLEKVFWRLALCLGVAVILFSPLVANFWLKSDRYSFSETNISLILMGIALIFQFPFLLYQSGMMGLERQVALNVFASVALLLRHLGGVFVLYLSASMISFFVWQSLFSLIQVIGIRILIFRTLRDDQSESVSFSTIKGFVLKMSGVSISILLFNQMDKILLSKMFPLEEFGYYCLAAALGGGILFLIYPIASAFFPRFTSLVALHNEDALVLLYHQGCQLVSALVFPLAIFTIIFSKEILLWWTKDPSTVQNINSCFPFLMAGAILHGLMLLPYSLQIAYGLTRWFIYQISSGILAFFLLIFWMVPFFGLKGAAITWCAANFIYLFVGIHLLHLKLMKGEKWHWILYDIGLPLTGSIIPALSAIYLLNQLAIPLLLKMFLLGSLALFSSFLMTPLTRRWFLRVCR